MTRQLLLVRHTEVAQHWHGRCYGSSDAGLSRAGSAHARRLAPTLAAWRADAILHSDRRRTRTLAALVADLAGLRPRADPGWRERDFGDWEGRRWSSIYRETGNAMDGMIDAPGSFRPGGGETTMELADRVLAAHDRLPAGRILVITHGGPIAALRGRHDALPVAAWPALTPAYGEGWAAPAVTQPVRVPA
ncbi:histidine phosphatase family protein [Polymorphobacter sp.]|uniref:histidine phosphatase family protein n=1 Tax=Polymorphobacter sp. TaxID=1909290 RepID=UPI003F6F3F25